MKRVLLHDKEPGRICEVRNPGEEFEVAEGFTWIDAPDDVTTTHRYDPGNGEFIAWNPLDDPMFVQHGYKIARQIAYKSVGEQLDMIYKEVIATGSISATGTWAQHVGTVKEEIPKDDPAAVLEWNRRLAEQMAQAQQQTP